MTTTTTSTNAVTIPTITVTRWLTCPNDGTLSYRSKVFTGSTATEDAEAWEPDPRCLECWVAEESAWVAA